MARSDRDRQKARRIRAARAKGKPLSDSDARWIVEYERPGAALEAARPPTRPQPMAPDPSGAWVPIEGDDEDEPDDDDDEDVSPATAEEPHAPSTLTTRVCTIPECPACAGRLKPGPQVCATTGESVYPEISMSTARMVAGFALWIIETAIRFFYKSDEVPTPTEIERDELARAIIEVTRRRFGAVAMVDDLIAPWYPISSYFGRARRKARESKRLPAPRRADAP